MAKNHLVRFVRDLWKIVPAAGSGLVEGVVTPLGERRNARYSPAMCGRFTNRLTWPEIVRLYRLPLDLPARNTQARYNICPTDPVDVVVERDGARALVPMRWGLVPFW